jgi:hypothetical protein
LTTRRFLKLSPAPLAVIGLLAALLGIQPGAWAANCSKTYHVRGAVADANDRPISRARVYLLLDETSRKKFHKQGVRAVQTQTDNTGWYDRAIVCGGQPNPCAKTPKNLTVFVDAPGGRARLVVFKLKDLDIREVGDGCDVEAPLVRLSAGS